MEKMSIAPNYTIWVGLSICKTLYYRINHIGNEGIMRN